MILRVGINLARYSLWGYDSSYWHRSRVLETDAPKSNHRSNLYLLTQLSQVRTQPSASAPVSVFIGHRLPVESLEAAAEATHGVARGRALQPQLLQQRAARR